jgi:hypothetical protein
MHMEWYSWEEVNQWHRYGIIINNLKCQIDLHHYDGLVETIEMDTSFAYIRSRMREICTRHHVDPVGPTPGHMETCCHTGAHVAMTPHRSKEAYSRPIRSKHAGSKGPQPRDNGLETTQTPPYPPWDPPGSHLDENRRDRGHLEIGRSPRSIEPLWGLLRRPSTCRLVVASQRWCQVYARISARKLATPHGRFTNLAPTPLRHMSPPHWSFGGA